MKTLSDIAKEMGVSKSTVSYIYHDKWRAKRISPELAAKVLAKLSEERAQPSMLGQQLRSGLTQTAGLLLPNLDQPYFLQLLSGLERRLGQESTTLFLGNTHRGSISRQTEFVENMVARGADRVILSPVPAPDLSELLDRIRARNVPIVFVNNYVADYDVPFAVSDNRWGAKQLTSRVLAMGRRKILFIGASPRVAIIADRFAGYQDALKEAGLEFRKDFVMWREGAGGDEKFTQTMRERFLTARNRPDALFFDSLFLSRRIVLLMHELGLKHPEDMVVCGFDYPVDLPRTAAFRETVLSPLLTVQQDARRMGTLAAELALHGTIDGSGERSAFIRPSLSWEEFLPGQISDIQGVFPMAQ